jgi:mono/diheme cytochrome c family protein
MSWRLIGPLLVGFALPVAAQAAEQAPAGDPAAGGRLAEDHCTTCHSAGSGNMSFASIARMPSTTSLSLHAFLLTSHPTMPNYRLPPEQIDDVVAYILNLREQ